jgi:hypothetical protein
MLTIFSQQPNVHIDLFCSLNSERDDYCKEAETLLSPWLKDIQYEKYEIPKECYRENNRYVDFRIFYNSLSCFYNDKKAYSMIMDYSKKNDIQYNIICKFRADIHLIERLIFPTLEENHPVFNNKTLFCCLPPSIVYLHGITTCQTLTDAFAFGSPEVMKHYCETYDFVTKMLEERKGKYSVGFEQCVTENFYRITVDEDTDDECEKKVRAAIEKLPYKVFHFNCPYRLHPLRRTRNT